MPAPVEVTVNVRLWLEGDWSKPGAPSQEIVERDMHEYLDTMMLKETGSNPMEFDGRPVLAVETRSRKLDSA